MMHNKIFFLTALAILPFAATATQDDADCKCVPGDSCWPSTSDFSSLNHTLSGRLIQGVPPASVCHTSQPNYNPAACEHVLSEWFNSNFHADDPISIGWPWWADNPCPPVFPNGTSPGGDVNAGTKGCSIGKFPAYAVNATEEKHVTAAVKFAKERGIRLNIKNTGHSFQGRSTAAGSLSVWTHNMKGIDYHENFQPEACALNGTQMAFTLGAGERDRDIYAAAEKHNAVVVGGENESVGIVGWFSGGGHSPLSQTYGLGVDNVLQVKVVTPDGIFRTANRCLNPDLFWVLRGGGGGTFGVITEVTMKAYPSPKVSNHILSVSAVDQKNLTKFWDVVADVVSEMPRLKEGGVQGYAAMAWPDWTFQWDMYVYDQPNGTTESLVAPILAKLDALNGTTVSYSSKITQHPSYFTAWNAISQHEDVAVAAPSLGSRLLPASALTNDTQHLARVLQDLSHVTDGLLGMTLELYLVANNDTTMIKETSVTPAWRDAVLHFIVTSGFPDWETYEQAKPILDVMTKEKVGALKALAPNSGAYLNECDPFDPDWQKDFWGDNYPRLKQLKKQYDPDSMLHCLSCVGSEDWTADNSGRLCRVPVSKLI